MCILCGDPDPLHGMGPAPLMLVAAGAMQVYAKVIKPLRRQGQTRPRSSADSTMTAPVARPRGRQRVQHAVNRSNA
jgi:hypothetical protein